MNYTIRGDHLEVTPALRGYVETKLSHLEKFDEAIDLENCRVTMRVLRSKHTVEATIPFGGLIFRAEESADDMYAAIDLVSDKLQRQFREYKDKLGKAIRHSKGIKEISSRISSIDSLDDHENFETVRIARVKRFDQKPMNIEEAVLQMELLGHSFFVFQNRETEEVNVVYKRKDGQYGLIESA